MAQELRAATRDVLGKASRGEVGSADLAGALKQIPSMILLLTPDAALAAAGESRVSDDPTGRLIVHFGGDNEPDPIGTVAQDGRFGPYVFTGSAGARAYARVHDLCGQGGVFYTLEKSWTKGLHQFLMRGYGGLIIDPESDCEIRMPRKAVAGLFAQYTLDQFAELDRVYAATAEGELHLQQGGEALQAIVFDHEKAARYFERKMQEEGVEAAGVRPVSVRSLLEELLEKKVEELIVNPMLPDIRFYVRDDLCRMRQSLGVAAAPAPVAAPAPIAAPAPLPPAAVDSAMLGRARAAEKVPPVSRPGRPSDEGRRFFQEWRRRFTLRLKEPWQLTEAMAFEGDLYVPRARPGADRLVWPATMPDPDPERKGSVMTPVYSSEEGARRAAEKGGFDGFCAVSGIEALRWIWSAPARTEAIYLDWQDDAGWARIPADWALGAIFPVFYTVPHRSQVQGAEPDRLGALPGSRALKPEVLRTLTRNWKSFLAVAVEKDRPAPTVPYRGGRYLPLFSSEARFLAYAPEPGAEPFRPLPTLKVQAGLPPYRTWLRAALDAEVDGVLIDPKGPAPLPLCHFDLLVLYLRASRPEAAFRPSVLIEAVSSLVEKGAVTETAAGRLVAGWPCYYACVERAEGGGDRYFKVPGAEAAAVFSELELAKAYVDKFAPHGALRKGAIRIEPVRSRWNGNLFLSASERSIRLRFDPSLKEAGGLELGQDGIGAALGQLDRLLLPRVPDFVSEIRSG